MIEMIYNDMKIEANHVYLNPAMCFIQGVL